MSNKSKRIPLNEVSHVALCGTTINPGDYVLASVTGSGRGSVRVGIYRGKYPVRFPEYAGSPSGCIALDVATTRQVLVHKVTREEYDFKLEHEEVPYPSYYDKTGKWVGYNNDEWDAWRAALNARKVDYEYETRPHEWRSVLQNNKVYSLAKLNELKRL